MPIACSTAPYSPRWRHRREPDLSQSMRDFDLTDHYGDDDDLPSDVKNVLFREMMNGRTTVGAARDARG